MNRIYLDNASTTPMDDRVIASMTKVMQEDFGNPSSIHHYGRVARSLIEDARKTIANILKASIGEVFFVSTATEAINMILNNSVQHHGVRHIISTVTEHHCVLHPLTYLQQQYDVKVTYLSVDEYGRASIAELQSLLQQASEPTMVSLMHGNNEIGTMNDVSVIGALCKEAGVLFHCDTVQTMGKYPIDVSEDYFSFISGSAHKFHGPKGSGFFYMNSENIIKPALLGGAQERNMRAGTENIYGIVGMATALQIATDEQAVTHAHILAIREYFKERLNTELHDIQYNGDQHDSFMAHVLSVSFPATEKADMLMFNLDIAGICVSSGSACSSGIESDSHVLVAIGHPADRKTIRFSFSKYTSMAEIDLVMDKLKGITPTK